MKKIALGAALLLATLNASADRPVRDRGDLNRNGLRVCQENLAETRARLSIALDDLDQCRERRGNGRRHGDRGEVRRLQMENQRLSDALNQADRENESLSLRNSDLLAENNNLIQENNRLKQIIDDLRNPPRPIFDLAMSIRACRSINNDFYAKSCATLAKQYEIQDRVISNCAEISNAYYAHECVKAAGTKGARARQVKACAQIGNDSYAVNCVSIVGERNIRADLINACNETSNNAYYRLECVKGL